MASKPREKMFSPIRLPDYRVIRPRIFLEEAGNTVASVQQISSIKIGSCQIEFITPNPVTLFYNKAWKEYESAEQIYREVIKPKLIAGRTYEVELENLKKVFDYIEHIQSSVITIFSAVEALSNVAIPNNYTLTITNNKGVTEIWDKRNIERWKSTIEKIGKLVPTILSLESPSSQSFWKDFIKLKEIRDDIIHQKQSSSDPTKIEEQFLSLLLNEDIFIKLLSAFELIKYFCEKDEYHTYFPVLKDEIPVKVENFDGTYTWRKE